MWHPGTVQVLPSHLSVELFGPFPPSDCVPSQRPKRPTDQPLKSRRSIHSHPSFVKPLPSTLLPMHRKQTRAERLSSRGILYPGVTSPRDILPPPGRPLSQDIRSEGEPARDPFQRRARWIRTEGLFSVSSERSPSPIERAGFALPTSGSPRGSGQARLCRGPCRAWGLGSDLPLPVGGWLTSRVPQFPHL